MKEFIILLFGGLGLYWYKRDLDKQYKDKEEQLDNERQEYIDEINELENVISPGASVPISFDGSLRIGGGKLDQIEITLYAKNESDIAVSIGDFLCTMVVEGVESQMVLPANIGKFTIQPKDTITFVLYRDNWNPYPSGVYDLLYDTVSEKESGISAYLNLGFIWYVGEEKEECVVRNLKLKTTFEGYYWRVRKFIGYNAAIDDEREKYPSHWDKDDVEKLDE